MRSWVTLWLNLKVNCRVRGTGVHGCFFGEFMSGLDGELRGTLFKGEIMLEFMGEWGGGNVDDFMGVKWVRR